MMLEPDEVTMDVVNEVHEDFNTEDNEETGNESVNSSDKGDVVIVE